MALHLRDRCVIVLGVLRSLGARRLFQSRSQRVREGDLRPFRMRKFSHPDIPGVLAEIEQNLVARDHDIGRTQIQIAPRQPAAMELLNRLGDPAARFVSGSRRWAHRHGDPSRFDQKETEPSARWPDRSGRPQPGGAAHAAGIPVLRADEAGVHDVVRPR
jgi:hypothetical protein